MKSETSALDLFFITKELQILKDGKLEKVFHNKDKKTEIVFRIYANQHGTKLLRIALPNYIYLSQYKSDFEQHPSGFAMFLRKHLKNARIKNITQHNLDRILVIDFETKKDDKFQIKQLLIELFSGGNVVLIDSSFKIMGLLNSVRKQDRTILPGKQYSFPDKKINPLLDETSIIEQVLKKSDKESIIKAIAIDFSLGGEYAELICRESKVDKNKKISELSQEDFQKIINFIKSLTNITPKGFIYEKSIKPLKDSDEKIIEKYETFCQAIDDSVTEKKYSEEKSLHQNISDKKISRIDNVLNKQEEMIKKILSDYEDNNKKGELIYNEYQDIKLLLDKINNLKKKNLTWNQIKSALENNKLKHVINEKKNEIIIEIEDQPIE